MRIALISVHGDPILQAGGKDAGGMNIYIREVAERLVNLGIDVDIFTRMHDRHEEIEEFLTHSGHNLTNCEWMAHKNPDIIIP